MNTETACNIRCLLDRKRDLTINDIQNYESEIAYALNELPKEIGYNITKKFEREINSTTQLELIITLTVKADRSNTIPYVVLFTMSHLLHRCKKLPLTFSITDAEFFDDEFGCRDENVEVHSIAFGIVHSKTRLIDVELNPSDYPEHRPYRKQWSHIWDNFFNDDDPVFRMDFLHDKKEIILRLPMIDYSVREYEEQNQNYFDEEQFENRSNASLLNEIQIKLLYANIRKITVDIISAEDTGFTLVEFCFHFLHCPSVFVAPILRNKKFPGRSSRHINWKNDFSIGNFLKDMIDSSTVFIRTKITKDILCKIINQIQDLVDCRVQYKKYLLGPKLWYTGIPVELFSSWDFEIRYLIDAIFSIGSVGRYRLLRTEREKLKIINHINRSRNKVELEEKLRQLFYEILQDGEFSDENVQVQEQSTKAMLDKDYENIRKVILTPTRVLLFPAEPVMGSRIVRKIGADRVIRAIFRDDTMDYMRNQNCPPRIINESVRYYLRNGLEIAGEQYHFLGYSNSQLRDHGCYFLRTKDKNEVLEIIQSMGNFKNEGVAKTMARFAQCFTQSRKSKIKLHPGNSGEVSDFQSCAKDSNGKVYCFSDGVGLISQACAKKLIQELKIGTRIDVKNANMNIMNRNMTNRNGNTYSNMNNRSVNMNSRNPNAHINMNDITANMKNISCVQFRSGGYKGVLSIDPFLDYQQKWLTENNITDPENKLMKCDVLFRISQSKFTVSEEEQEFEVVKHSSPVSVRLNKQLINIFDQVSEGQSLESSTRIRKRILELVNEHITNAIQSLIDDVKFRDSLLDLPVYAPVHMLSSYSTLVHEPFFRSMVVAKVKASLKGLNEKKQIIVPPDQGRIMFGVVDPYGILQYGQVFIQYSKSTSMNSFSDIKTILKGAVAISKNPMCSPGDLRMFEAIDVPALRHMVNTVVFPQSGPRPHPDEMAGSDLDGDEYSVIWDSELILERNEDAFNYAPSASGPDLVELENLIQKSTDFFVDYMSMDLVGQIANAHLANSDCYGLNSEVCTKIARKQTTAVDFAKTGSSPEALTRSWISGVPPERPERYPDFMDKDHLPAYESPRLLGIIHRKISKIFNRIFAILSSEEEKPPLDQAIDIAGWGRYKDQASALYEKYSSELDHLMVAYGVVNEGELFSQQFTVLKQPLNKRENDNMSSFTTANLIQTQIFKIFTFYRTKFFETFDFHFSSIESKEILRQQVTATEGMKQFAVACYKIAYKSGTYLSFPWIAWDIIDQVRMDKRIPWEVDPIGEIISKEITTKPFAKYDTLKSNLRQRCPAVIPYLDRYEGLGRLLYFIIKWKEQHPSLDDVNKPSLCLLFIKFGLGLLPSPRDFSPFLEETNSSNKDEKVDLRNKIGGLGRILIWFFASLGSDEFSRITDFDFNTPNLGPNSARFDPQLWSHLHEAGLASYLNIACKINPTVLLPYDEDGTSLKRNIKKAKSSTPFVVEVPRNRERSFINSLPNLQQLSGCTYIAHYVSASWMSNRSSNIQITLWPKGTPSQIHKLRKILTVRPELQPDETPSQTSERIGQMFMNNIHQIINNSQ